MTTLVVVNNINSDISSKKRKISSSSMQKKEKATKETKKSGNTAVCFASRISSALAMRSVPRPHAVQVTSAAAYLRECGVVYT